MRSGLRAPDQRLNTNQFRPDLAPVDLGRGGSAGPIGQLCQSASTGCGPASDIQLPQCTPVSAITQTNLELLNTVRPLAE